MTAAKSRCCVESCGKPARSAGAIYCEAHYMRVRRHGSTDKKDRVKPGLLEHSGGYLLAHLPGHPLARQSKRVYEHRAVFHAAHGDGPFKCHWCSVGVSWSEMHVDHLNDDPQDNTEANLVASCPGCNQKRGAHKMRQSLKEAGRMVTAHGKTMCLSDWARHLGLSRAALACRLDKGIEPDKAMTAERGKTGPARRRQPIPEYRVDCQVPQLRTW